MKNTGKTKKITYAEFFDLVGNKILCNEMEHRLFKTLFLVSGDIEDKDIFQWYIVSNAGAEFIKSETDEILFFDDELQLYVLGVTFYGISFKYAYTHIYSEYKEEF